MQPRAAQIRFPAGYGTPTRRLDWDAVRGRLVAASHYWLATTRPDARPHVVPVDGVWLDDAWYFGGHHDTVHQRTLRANPQATIHLEDATAPVIVEGRAEWVTPPMKLAQRLAAASREKYGYAPRPQAYRDGVWALRPHRVLAWNSIADDATRFTFDA